MNQRRRVSLVKHVHILTRHMVQLNLAGHSILIAATKQKRLLFKRSLFNPVKEVVPTVVNLRPLISTNLRTIEGSERRHYEPLLSRRGPRRAWDHLMTEVTGSLVRRCVDQHVRKGVVRVPECCTERRAQVSR